MKMDVPELINGGVSNQSEGDTVPCATDIGREFVRQYYTLLSENPNSVYRFYSHESVFVNNEVQAVGQQKIQKAIEEMGFVECKVRIHSIKGAHTLTGGIVLQVCGELAANVADATKRFVQTFVLCQQTAKKFYVQNDIFQFIEQGFSSASGEAEMAPAHAKASEVIINSQSPAQPKRPNHNGHKTRSPPAEPAKTRTPPTGTSSGVSSAAEKKAQQQAAEKNATPSKKEETLQQPVPEESAKPAVVPTPAALVNSAPVAKAQLNNAEEPVKPQATEPMSWAKRVGGGGGSATTTAAASTPALQPVNNNYQKPQPTAPSNTAVHQNNVTQNGDQKKTYPSYQHKQEERGTKLYIGGILRNKIPNQEDHAAVEAQLFNIFSQIGEVDTVQIPPKVYEPVGDGQHRSTAFAFITMKSTADVNKIFAACQRDDSNAYRLKMAVEAFAFDGEATVSLSEPKVGAPRGGARWNRGGRGGFAPKGKGGPPRGAGGGGGHH